MQIDGQARSGTDRRASFLMLALEPPGNIVRDLALYRRALFSESGDPSCFLLPELVPLAFTRREPLRRSAGDCARRAFEGAWKAASGSFSSSSAIESHGLLYLSLDGPLEALSSVSSEAIPGFSSATRGDSPLDAGIGFFLCRSSPGALGYMRRRAVPRISFLDCALVLLSIRFGLDPFSSASWRELARSRRPTGPRSRAGLTSSSRE